MSELTLVIGNRNYSSWSLRPWVFLKHHAIPFREKRVALFTDTSDAELAPYGSDYKVPVLRDGERTVWDSLAILEYLAEKFPATRGWPEDPDARARARTISAEMHSSFVSLRSELPMNCRRQFAGVALSAAAEREIARVRQLWRETRQQFGQGGEWLFGDYGIADAMFAPVALRFAGYSIPLDGPEADYVESVLAQPCIQEWMEAGRAEKEVIEADEIDG